MKKMTYTEYNVARGERIIFTTTDWQEAESWKETNRADAVLPAKCECWLTDRQMTECLVKAYNDYMLQAFSYQGSYDDYNPEDDAVTADDDLTDLGLLYCSDGNDNCFQWTLNIPELWAWCKYDGDETHCVDLFFKDEDELLQWLTNLNEDDLIYDAECHTPLNR